MKKILLATLVSTTCSLAYAQHWQAYGPQVTPDNANSTIAPYKDGFFVAHDDASYGTISVNKTDGKKTTYLGDKDFSKNQAYSIAIAAGTNGTPYVIYRDAGMSNQGIVKKFDGKAWVMVGNEISEGYIGSTAITVDKDNVPYIAFEDDKKSRLVVEKFVNNTWTPIGELPEYTANFIQLAFDRTGSLYLAFSDVKEARRATLLKLTGDKWTVVGKSPISAHEAKDLSIAFDTKNTPYVSYDDAFDDNKIYVKKLDPATSDWKIVGEQAGATSSYEHLSMVMVNNAIYIAYCDRHDHPYAPVVRALDQDKKETKWTTLESPGVGGDKNTLLTTDGTSVYLLYTDNKTSDRNCGVIKKLVM